MRRKVFWRMWCLRLERASLPQGSMNDISPTKGKNITISWTLTPDSRQIPAWPLSPFCQIPQPRRCLVHNVLPIGHRERNGVGRAVGRCGSTFHYDGRRTHSVFRLFKLSGTAIKDLKRTTEELFLPWSFSSPCLILMKKYSF